MPTNENKDHVHDLEAKIRVLEAENQELIEHNKEILLLGLIAESISSLELPNSILEYTLERIAILKKVTYCAFCEILDDEVIILSSYSTCRENHTSDERIAFSTRLIQALSEGPQILSEEDIDTKHITLDLRTVPKFPKPFCSFLFRPG